MCGQAAPPLQLKVVTVKCSGLVKRRYERQNTELARQCAALQAQLKKEQLEVHALRRENLRLAGLVSQLERAAKAQQQRLNELKILVKERMPAIKKIAVHLSGVSDLLLSMSEDPAGNETSGVPAGRSALPAIAEE